MKSAVEAETSTPGIVIVDSQDYINNREAYVDLETTKFPKDWKIHVTEAVGMGDKIREVWGRVRDCAWVNILNDDHYIITKNWDTKLIKQLNGKNFVTCNDRYQAPARAAGATMFSMPLLEAVGWPIFPPQINHLAIDDVWEKLGRTTGVWRVDMQTVIEHRHIYKGAAMDDTHRLTYGEGPWQNSPAHVDVAQRMQIFLETEFPAAVERIKKFAGVQSYFARSEKPIPVPEAQV